MQVARELADQGYPREAGPGVYDIHSPRVPSANEAAELLRIGLKAIPAERLWVNPDCGLRTRAWPETRASLENLVAAARTVRTEPAASRPPRPYAPWRLSRSFRQGTGCQPPLRTLRRALSSTRSAATSGGFAEPRSNLAPRASTASAVSNSTSTSALISGR